MSDTVRMGIREARNHLTQRVEAAHFHGEPTIITKNDEPRAVLVSYAWFEDATRDGPGGKAVTVPASGRLGK